MGAMGSTSVVYMTLVNEWSAADRLLGVQTDVAASAEIHQTAMTEQSAMKMQPPPEGIEVPAGGRIEIKPGGYHIMLIGLQHNLPVGDRFPVTLPFEQSGTLTVESEVRAPW